MHSPDEELVMALSCCWCKLFSVSLILALLCSCGGGGSASQGSGGSSTNVPTPANPAPSTPPPPASTPSPTPPLTPTPPVTTVPLSQGRYDIGSPVLTTLHVAPNGNDSNDGLSALAPLRTLALAWQRVPGDVASGSTGYRILMAPGSYPKSSLPNY